MSHAPISFTVHGGPFGNLTHPTIFDGYGYGYRADSGGWVSLSFVQTSGSQGVWKQVQWNSTIDIGEGKVPGAYEVIVWDNTSKSHSVVGLYEYTNTSLPIGDYMFIGESRPDLGGEMPITYKEKINALKQAHEALDNGKKYYKNATDVERAMIDALAERFPTDPNIEDYSPWNDAFSECMRSVYNSFPNDLEVTAIFAESLINRTPWKLWDLKNRVPAEGASTTEAQDVLERAFNSLPESWEHPGLLHMYIHLMEMSPTPEKALLHGDKLVDLVPDSGHLVHMATHIDVLCGDYQNVVSRNHKATEVDKKFVDYAGAENFYTVYRVHNLHFKIYGAMFLAQPTPALSAALQLKQILPELSLIHI